MIRVLVDGFVGAFRVHPMMATFILLLAFSSAAYAVNNFADKTEVEKLNTRIDVIELKIERGDLDAAMRAIESEIYSLERLDSSGKATARDLDRLARLRVELGQKQRELERLED